MGDSVSLHKNVKYVLLCLHRQFKGFKHCSLCYLKMVVPRASVFQLLVKGNKDSAGNETGESTP